MYKKTSGRIKLLQNLLPAAITGLLIACGASAMEPSLAQVPELLEYTASVQDGSAEKPKLKDTASLTKAAKSKKKKQANAESSTEAFADQDSYEDGVYTGSAQGFGGTITVQVTVTGGKIADVAILSAAGETASYLEQARGVISRIISAGSPNVDVVSGATFSSNGILNAVKRALSGAGGSSADMNIVELTPVAQDSTPAVLTPVTIAPSAITAKPSNELKDGSYVGSAYGFGGPITVNVSIVDGKIAGISVVTANGETGSFFNQAQAVIPQILTAQSPNVDSVSGATYSSNGIKDAVRNAIAQAVITQQPSIPDEEVTTQQPSVPDKEVTTQQPSIPDEKDNSSVFDPEIEEPVTWPDLWKKELSEITESPEKELKDGIYRGLGEGFGGDIELEITIQEGKVVQIEVIAAEKETPAFFNKAKALLGDILEKQSSQVDVVSGATFSSEGILEALEEALEEAVKAVEDSENPEDTEKPESTDKPESTENPEDTEKTESTDKPESTEKPENPEDTVKTEGTEKPEDTVKTESIEKPEGTEKSKSQKDTEEPSVISGKSQEDTV